MRSVCRIVADIHEVPSGVPAMLRAAGTPVVVQRLEVGDYALGAGVLVERKSVLDLHESLVRGRLWPQLGRLRSTARVPCLLVEGVRLDGPVDRASVRAALLAASDLGVIVLRSTSRPDTADWLVSIRRRAMEPARHRLRPAYAQRAQPRGDDVSQAMLAAVPGISTATARTLLQAFGSVANVLRADDDELGRVRGMGPARIRALRRAAF